MASCLKPLPRMSPDTFLRQHGFRIVARPAGKEPTWRRDGRIFSEREAFADPEVDAVLIASSTDTHARLAIAAARAGKAIFCEKPVDLTLAKVEQCIAAVKKAKVPMFVGFNRRFDPSFRSLKERLDAGAIGSLEQVIRTRVYLKKAWQADEVARAHRDVFAGVRPATTFVGAGALIDPDALVEIEATAHVA